MVATAGKERSTSFAQQLSVQPRRVSGIGPFSQTMQSVRPFSESTRLSPERVRAYSLNASLKGGVGAYVAQGLAAGASGSLAAFGWQEHDQEARLASRIRKFAGSLARAQHTASSQEGPPGVQVAPVNLASRNKPAFCPYVRCALSRASAHVHLLYCQLSQRCCLFCVFGCVVDIGLSPQL